MCVAYLDETDVGALLTEALTADVEAVLPDETGLVGADAAVQEIPLAAVPLPSKTRFPAVSPPRNPPSSISMSCRDRICEIQTYHSRAPLP